LLLTRSDGPCWDDRRVRWAAASGWTRGSLNASAATGGVGADDDDQDDSHDDDDDDDKEPTVVRATQRLKATPLDVEATAC
jgi:hypothetical protein